MTTITSKSDLLLCEQHIDHILRIHQDLRSLPSLSPSAGVNACFTELVSLAIAETSPVVAARILQDSRVKAILPSIHEICSRGECMLEAHWAESIICARENSKKGFLSRWLSRSCNTSNHLQDFPYFENYELLTRLELNAIRTVTPHIKRIAFIGSGPLPLTSLCMLKQLKTNLFSRPKITNIDCNPDAIEQSRTLCRLLGRRASGMQFFCTKTTGDLSLKEYDVVFLAALAGLTQADKEDLVMSTLARMRADTVIVIRSVWGIRGLLYPEFDGMTDRMRAALEICLIVHPHGKVVNSVIIGRKMAQPDVTDLGSVRKSEEDFDAPRLSSTMKDATGSTCCV